MIGSRFAHYEIICHLGTGGMGEVYQAIDSKLRRSVAIKLLPEAFNHDSDRLARFEREARVLASLNHPNIAAIHGLEESGGRKFLVMELVPGETLAERIKRSSIPLSEALEIATQVTHALEAAHEKNVVHRDLKPANVKITAEGVVKVLDFGLAKAYAPDPAAVSLSDSPTLSALATQQGVIMGTAAYMSPEQAKGKEVDRRTDIFAFGAVLYEMLSGRPAFEGDGVQDILGSVLKSEPDWTRLPPDVPASIHKLLRVCLQKDLKKRRQTVADVRIDIEEALKEPPQISPSSVVAADGRKARLPWIVAGCFALIAAGVIATFGWRPPAETPESRLLINRPPATDLPSHFALSPDGRHFVFTGRDGNTNRLWLRPMDKTDARQIAGTEGASHPFWSPDSNQIGFFANAKLYRIDLDGGRPQELAAAPFPRGGSWSHEGVIVFCPGDNSPLLRVPSSGGVASPLTQLDPPRQSAHLFPQFLPDGRRFLYQSEGTPGGAGIYLGSLDGDMPKRLSEEEEAAAYLHPDRIAFIRQDTTLVARKLDLERGLLTGDLETIANPVASTAGYLGFSATADGRVVAYRLAPPGRQLTWYDHGGKPGMASRADENLLNYPELLPGGRIAVDRTVQGNRDVWLMELDREALSPLTSDPSAESAPIGSPDGAWILFRTVRKGQGDLYMRRSNGAATERAVLETPLDAYPQDWSSMNGFLLYLENNPKTGFDLYAVEMPGGTRKTVANHPMYSELQGQFSPDGRWVAYTTNETGRSEVVVQSFPELTVKMPVSTDGGAQPRWRADNKELYFIALDGKLMSVSIDTSGGTLQRGKPMALFPTRIVGTAAAVRPQYAVANGRFLINETSEGTTASPVVIISNWKPKP